MNVSLETATEQHYPAIVALMNAAFRGTGEGRSWCVEGEYIAGARTNESLLREEIAAGALYLVAKNASTAALDGCVSLQKKSEATWYLGALTVNPALQKAGLGRELLAAAEDYAASHGATTIEMTVVNVRDTLIAWYERRGYQRTGEERPFPYGDNRYGTPTRPDLAFVVLARELLLPDASYTLSLGTPPPDEYRRLRVLAGLSHKSAEGAAIGLPGTLFGVMIHHREKLVGMGRIVGDGGLAVQLVDIAVDPAHQGRGLGKAIVGTLVNHLRKTAPSRTHVTLLADGPAEHLYAQFGFKLTAPASVGMGFFIE
jgi:ribosomal protein S18 acetylase RimI-like enzyme